MWATGKTPGFKSVQQLLVLFQEMLELVSSGNAKKALNKFISLYHRASGATWRQRTTLRKELVVRYTSK